MKIILPLILFLVIILTKWLPSDDTRIRIHMRGVFETKITLMPLTGKNSLKPIIERAGVRNGQTIVLEVEKDYLPGEFILQFDLKENSSSRPQPSEKKIIINRQEIEIWVHPLHLDNPDSTWFRKGEKENTTYQIFMKENGAQKEKISLLQNVLLYYDEPGSDFYRMTILEYEKRRQEFNSWLEDQKKHHKSLFASTLFSFQYIPQIKWEGNEAERRNSLRENYFNGMDFRDTMLTKTYAMKEWMDSYVNLYGELAISIRIRDSVFTIAGRKAIEMAKNGHPKVYGWMVDYFFDGYERFNLEKGIMMLRQYLDDPNCLTSKRQDIIRRITGITTLKPGIKAPNIVMRDSENLTFDLYAHQSGKKFTLLLFWSADCNHCNETVEKISKLYLREDIRQKLEIVAVSIDETDTEVQAWRKRIFELKTWKHLRAQEGIRSKVAADYYVLGVPVLILLDSGTGNIIGLPSEPADLEKLLK
jgi:hypothetical protein